MCCVFLCVISNQSTSKKTKGPSDTKVPRLEMCISIISLSKIAHQMWRDHPIQPKKQDNRKSSGGGDCTLQGRWGVGQNLKKEEGGQYRDGGLHKKRGLGPLCQL